MNINGVILGTIETEKALNKLQPQGKYVFVVDRRSTKIDVKNLVEKMYGVTVTSVNTIQVRKKTRTVGRGKTVTKRDFTVKAIVTLKKGEVLDFGSFGGKSDDKEKKPVLAKASKEKSNTKIENN